MELRWRETHSQHFEEQLEKRLDSFLGLFCIPMMYQWVKYTKKRHKSKYEDIENDRLQQILDKVVKADTLDEKLIAVELCMNARHYTNNFPDHLASVSIGEKTAYQEYYENLDRE